MKIIFEQKKINNGTVKISLDGGVTYEEYEIADILESGISLKEDQDLSLIKIKGPANILKSAEVISSIKVGDMRGIIFSNGRVDSSDSYKDLTTIDIKSGTTEIGPGAFRECSSLTSVTIPDTVTSIWKNAFQGCSNLANINIPDSVTSIGNGAFSGCSSLTSINIPSNVSSINADTFYGCSGLKSINISNGVTSISNQAFLGCSSITNIEIPESVTTIGNRVFDSCTNLTTVTIPDSITSIGHSVFKYCPNLTTIYYAGTLEQWNGLLIYGQIWNNDLSVNVICAGDEKDYK